MCAYIESGVCAVEKAGLYGETWQMGSSEKEDYYIRFTVA